jgi:3-mercaptopyruvate sulfurtransferase SseA
MAFLPPSSTHALISTEELAQNLPRVKVLDGTYLRLPMFGDRDADKEYLEGHIPGAIRFVKPNDHSIASACVCVRMCALWLMCACGS